MNKQNYTKKELAYAYAPNLTPKAALNRLMLWINTNRPLCRALANSGYSKMQKKLTCRQAALVFRYLGEPNLNNL